MVLPIIGNIIMLGIFIAILAFMQKKHINFTYRVLVALVLGLLLGFIVRKLYEVANNDVITQTMVWYNVVANGYVRLLQMLIMPLIFVSITTAILNIKSGSNIGKISLVIIGVLVVTTGVAAFIGAMSAKLFSLNAENLLAIVGDISKGAANYQDKLGNFTAKPIPQQVVEIIPTNPFYALTGGGGSPTLSVVFFAALIGTSAVGLRKKKAEVAEFFTKIMNSLHDIVMRIVAFVMRLTPYGVVALMARFMATSDFQAFAQLGKFVAASYVALFAVLIVHTILLVVFGYNPIRFYSKASGPLAFAFSSRTSAGTLPLAVSCLKDKMGISEGISNLSASLAVSIGQNGCAGVYPAMVAVMIAPTLGINPFEPMFLIKMIVIIAVGSFGIAGVGGGATNAALITLSALGFPVELVAVLLGIEPLIDMGRTLINVNDGMVTAAVTGKVFKEVDMEKFNSKDVADTDSAA